jgi:predicted GNAT family acetyltransferase
MNDAITMRLGAASLQIGTTEALPLRMRAGVLEVSKVWCPPGARGQGAASRLMAEACAAADRAHKVLLVSVEPDEKGPLDQFQLIAWYGKQGFIVIQPATEDIPALMARPPNTKVMQ